MSCDKCGSERMINVSGKTSDMCYCRYKDQESDSYVPKGLPFSDEFGDYIEFELCLECGKMQGKFPVSDQKVQTAMANA